MKYPVAEPSGIFPNSERLLIIKPRQINPKGINNFWSLSEGRPHFLSRSFDMTATNTGIAPVVKPEIEAPANSLQ